MEHTVTVLPENRILTAVHGESLLPLLRRAGIFPDAPCGGNGKCGKCTVLVDGIFARSCQCSVTSDITVLLSAQSGNQIQPTAALIPQGELLLAVDIGTTSVVCALLRADGRVFAQRSAANPQRAFGADVVSRISCAIKGARWAMTEAIRHCADDLTILCCSVANCGPDCIRTVCIVGNPCMQQLFLGLDVDTLAQIPFTPAIMQEKTVAAGAYIPSLENAQIRIAPSIAGYIGSDALACVLAAGLEQAADTVLLVDIGTNAEIVLCHNGQMAACATAAGPALEGAKKLELGSPCPNVLAIEALELGSLSGFARQFARNMQFREETWLVGALKCGFTHAAPLDISTLKSMEVVRASCVENRCRAYGKNWTCPPYCGTLEECEKKMHEFSQGVLLQTVGVLSKAIDTRGMRKPGIWNPSINFPHWYG